MYIYILFSYIYYLSLLLLLGMGDPWVPETHVGTGLGQMLHPSWVMGFLIGLYNFYGYRFRIVKPAGLCPLPSLILRHMHMFGALNIDKKNN